MNTTEQYMPVDATLYIKENIRTFWNKRSRIFDEDIGHGADETECRLWKKYLEEIIGSEKRRILDVGTGTGMIALNLAELGHDVTGIDLGEQMIEIARKKASDRNITVTFSTGDAENPDFPDDNFDCVICRHLLWTLPHPDKAVREWIRITKDKGLVIAIDGHAIHQDYFPEPDAEEENLSERSQLWHRMYSKEVQNHLPLSADLSVKNLTRFFSDQNLGDIRSWYIEEISNYQKRLMEIRNEVGEECEVNIIWGKVRKQQASRLK